MSFPVELNSIASFLSNLLLKISLITENIGKNGNSQVKGVNLSQRKVDGNKGKDEKR